MMTVRIMVIDDEIATENLYRRLFRNELRTGEVDILYASNGMQGFSVIQSLPEDRLPHLVVLDLNMPGLNGLEIAALIRNLHASLKIVILTAYGSEAHREKASALGVNRFLEKPTDIYQLQALIHELTH